MGSACTSSSSTTKKLIQKYGDQTMLDYVTNSFGASLVAHHFGQTKMRIVERFNMSNQSKADPNMVRGILDKVT